MTLGIIIQTVINGLTIGATYALLALGLTLLFSIMDILFFAHGAMYMLGAFMTYYLNVKFGINYLTSAILTIIIIASLNILIEKIFFKWVRGQLMVTFFIAIALMWFMESVCFAVFGIVPRSVESFVTAKVSFLGVTLIGERVMLILVGLAAVLGLHFFLVKTRWGLGMRAYAEDREAAELQGIDNDFVCSLGFAIAGVLAALAGFLAVSVFLATPGMGESAVLNSMLIIGLGGLGSIPGALIAALLIGFVESFSGTLIGADYTWGPMFIFVMVFLIFKPTGIKGIQR